MKGSSDMYLLGISAFYHDSAAALIRDGEIIAAAQEERFTRKKHDSSFPIRSVQYCLAEAGISIDDVEHVVFYEKPFLKFERLLLSYLETVPFSFPSFAKAVPLWLKKKLWLKQIIKKELRSEKDIRLLFTEHHEAHAASAFFPSPFKEAAVLTLDGVGEWATSSIAHGKNNTVTIQKELRFPNSLGLLYSAFTYYTGFRVNSGEYKVMGLAPYGEPTYTEQIYEHLIDLKADGSFTLNMDYFNFIGGLTMTNRRFNKLFGGRPRRPESTLTRRHLDLARSIQEVTEEIMLRMARTAHALTGSENLCLAGGVALNCVGNGRILKEGPFKNIWIQPAAGDAGGALGAALAVWYQALKSPRDPDGMHDAQKGSYLGPHFSSREIEDLLKKNDIPYRTFTDRTALWKEVAALLAQEKVVGLFNGRMEFGPRALGTRSILGDARSPRMQKTMNLKIKYRESFRPFAPAVLAEDRAKYFELGTDSPYMLLTAPVKKERLTALTPAEQGLRGLDMLAVPRSDIPAVTHVDTSARVQTVHADTNPDLHALLEAFKALTGSSVLINTSFNVRGEPIVRTPEDAFRCFMRTDMDHLVLENFILDKTAQRKLNTDDTDRLKKYALD